MKVAEKPTDLSKIKAVVFEEIYEPVHPRDAQCFIVGVGWVKKVSRKAIAYEVDPDPDDCTCPPTVISYKGAFGKHHKDCNKRLSG